jgi:cell division protein FtsW
LTLGLIMVASSSMVISDRMYGSPFHFLFRQLLYVGVSIFVAIVLVRVPIKFWEKVSKYLLLLSLILLILVLVPGLGRQVNGSMRWIGFGPLQLQVSELAKFSMVIYLAGYLVQYQKEVRTTLVGFVKPLLVLGLLGIFLLLEPDFGAVTVMALTALGLLFLAGARLWQFIVLVIVVLGGLALLAVASPYRMLRLTAFLHPWANQFSSGYQLTQSLMAFGRGGFFGVGLGNSIQKLFYLPEAYTDFLFAVLAEELGLVGVIVVVFLFAVFVVKGLFIGLKAYKKGNPFAAYMAYGFSLWLGLQAMVNIGVNIGILPTKGLTLPFMSYGGSSIILNCAAAAILLRIYHETRIATPKRTIQRIN